jgi:hypothetical protein
MVIRFSVILFMVFILNEIHAQRERNYVIMPGVRGHYGFIVRHTSTIQDITWSKPRGFEIEAGWLLMSENSWKYCFCYPRAGLSFFFIDFGNPEILGNSFSLYAFVEPLIGAERRLFGTVRFGIGPAYMDNVYDSIDNPANKFYSSHLSFVVLLNAGIHYRINNNFIAGLSGSFNHISNGGIKMPNSGINYPTISLGADYIINPIPFQDRMKDKSIRMIPYKGRFDVSILGTGKTEIKGEERYPVAGLFAGYCRTLGRINGLMMGMEFTADFADKHEITRISGITGNEIVDYKYLAALLGHDLLLGRFNFQIQLGAYIYSPFKRMDPVFQRYGLSFYLIKQVFIGINLKTHRHVADFLDMRIGYSF